MNLIKRLFPIFFTPTLEEEMATLQKDSERKIRALELEISDLSCNLTLYRARAEYARRKLSPREYWNDMARDNGSQLDGDGRDSVLYSREVGRPAESTLHFTHRNAAPF